MSPIENKLVKYLTKHTPLSGELISIIVETSNIKSYKRGTILLREGELSNECYLILKGCVRSYKIKDGEEMIIDFYTEEQPISPINFGTSIPSEHYLECMEDTVACVGTPDLENEMFRNFPEIESACRIVTESIMGSYQSSFADFRTTSAEERYLKLQKERPELIRRVPQYQFASYLGIKPESLSRIRRRLIKKNDRS